jgi:DNA polymerase I-like protein with 3'-5' exonuclease and polymerase domains
MAWMTKVHQGRIHGYVNTNGAVTGRMTHSNPNIAQVPSCGKPYGAECRELFYAPEGYNLVGFDVSGLELRCLANYIKPRIKEGEFNYVREILEGDVHTTNQQTFGFPGGDKWRNVAKTFIYALIYGAGDAKLGKISGKGAKEGRNLKRRLFDKVPALDRLKKQIDSRLDDVGYLKGLDGRKLRCRSKRSALNTLLQSAGAVIMKVLLVIVYKKIREQGLTVHFVANIHDEFQMEVKIQDTQYLRPIFDQSLLETQEWLRLKVPLEGKLIVGKNWKETH